MRELKFILWDNFLKVSTSQMFKALIELRFPATIPVSSHQDTGESLSCDEKDMPLGIFIAEDKAYHNIEYIVEEDGLGHEDSQWLQQVD